MTALIQEGGSEALALPIQLIQEGNEQALLALLLVHGPKTLGYLRNRFRDTLEDDDFESVLNEATIKARDRIEQFDRHRGPLGVWFLTIALNIVRDLLRTRQKQVLHLIDVSLVPDPRSLTADDDERLAALAKVLHDIIDDLPSRQREVIDADLGVPISDKELADQIGAPTAAAVSAARIKAHKKIREELIERGLEPTGGRATARGKGAIS